MRSNRRVSAIAATTGLLAVLLPSLAAAQGPNGPGRGTWALRGFAAWIDTDIATERSGSFDNFPPIGETSFSIGDGDGFGLSLEYRLNRRVGIEALAIFADIEGEFRATFTDPPIPEQVVTKDVKTDFYGLGVDVHLTPGRRIDVYVGPVVAAVRYGDFVARFDGGDPFERFVFQSRFSDDTAFGATLGADFALGQSGRWAASAVVRRLWSNPDEEVDSREVDLDPWIGSAGIAFRWGGR